MSIFITGVKGSLIYMTLPSVPNLVVFDSHCKEGCLWERCKGTLIIRTIMQI